MKYITYPLVILIFVAFFNIMLTASTVFSGSGNFSLQSLIINQTLDGNQSTLEMESTSQNITINMEVGFIALIVGVVALSVVGGVRILGSGLSAYSIMVISHSAIYYGVWGIFSALAFTGFASIPIFGLFIWFFLTVIYTIGFFQTLNTSGGMD